MEGGYNVMSREIDERVVSMQFDNAQFEKNVSQTMSSLDKLKEKLRLSGSAKAAQSEFASYKAGFINFRDIINKMWAGLEHDIAQRFKNILKAFTIDPVKTGLQEYETQIGAIQTILANTESKGTTLTDVNNALDELNKYADKTIYNFTEMTRNIGTFTAAGVDLDTSVNAIQGIANLAAVSGSTSQQASTAMYQLSQALASGTVKLMDWNSVVNAGMGGQVFQDALKETARVHGVAIDDMIAKHGSFRESLSEGWITSEILTETLQKFTLASEEMTEAEKEQAKAMLKSKGYTDEQIAGIFKLGNTATNAATKVKTFSQLMDTLKESAQSGWTQTWELIIGDFEEAKELWSNVSDVIGGFINRMSEARNNFLQGALNFATPWKTISDKLGKSNLGKIEKVGKSFTKAADKIKYFQDVVNKVWGGDFGTAETGRYDLLEKAGYNPKVVQELVNLGKEHKITTQDIEAAYKKYGLTLEDTVDGQVDMVRIYDELTDEQLEKAGLTKDEIKLYRDLSAEAKRTGRTVNELIDAMTGEKTNGRALLLDSIANVGRSLAKIFGTLKQAWIEIFPPMSSVRLYTIIEALNRFTKGLIMSDETADKVKRTLKGVFAILDVIFSILGTPFKVLFNVIKAVAGLFNMTIWDLTALVGDAAVAFRDWFKSINPIGKAVEIIGGVLIKGIKNLSEWIGSLKKSDNIALDIVRGLVNGLKKGAKAVIDGVLNLGKLIIKTIKKVLGIHSPSVIFYAIGAFCILGLLAGLGDGANTVLTFIKNLGSKMLNAIWDVLSKGYKEIKDVGSSIIDFFKEKFGNINWEKILSIGGITLLLVFLTKVLRATSVFGDIIKGAGNIIEAVTDGIAAIADFGLNFNRMMKAFSFYLNTKGLINIAIAIGILVASIFALTLIDPSRIWQAVGVIAVLGVLVAGILALAALCGKTKAKLGIMSVTFIGIGISLLLAAWAIKIIAGIPEDGMWKAIGVVALLGVILGILGIISKKAGKNTKQMGKVFKSFAFSLLILALALKILGGMSEDELIQGGAVVLGFAGLMMGLAIIVKKSGKNTKQAGKVIKSFAWSLILLSLAMKIIGGMDPTEIAKGLAIVTGFGFLMMTLIKTIKGSGKNAKQMAKVIHSFGITLMLLAIAMKILGGMSEDELIKGGLVAAGFGLMMYLLVKAIKDTGKDAKQIGSVIKSFGLSLILIAWAMKIIGGMTPTEIAKGLAVVVGVGLLLTVLAQSLGAGKQAELKGVGKTILLFGMTILILAVAMKLLGSMTDDELVNASKALALAGGIVVALIAVSKLAGNVESKTIIAFAITVGVLAVSLLILSLLNQQDLINASVALSIVIGVVSLLLKAVNNINTGKKAFTRTIITLGVLTLVVVALGAVILMLSNLDPGQAIGSAFALALLTGALILVMHGLNNMGKVSKGLITSIGALALLTLAIALIAGALYLCKDLNPGQSILMGLALAGVAAAFVALATVLGQIGSLSSQIMMGSAALAVLTVAVGIIAGLLALCNVMGLEPGKSILMGLALAGVAGAFALVGAALGILGTFMVPIMLGSAALAVLSVAVGLMAAVLALCNAMGLEPGKTIQMGLALAGVAAAFVLLGAGLAALGLLVAPIGAGIIALGLLAVAVGILFGISFMLPGLGDNLQDFADKIVPFSEAVKTLDGEMVQGVKNLVAALVLLGGASFVSAISSIGDTIRSWFGGEDSLTKQLRKFANAIVVFSSIISGKVDIVAMTTVTNAINALSKIQDLDPGKFGRVGEAIGKLGEGAAKLNGKDFSGITTLGNAVSPIQKLAAINAVGLAVAITQVDRLAKLASGMSSMNFSGMSSFGKALKNVAAESINAFVRVFDNSVDKTTRSVNDMVSSTTSGVKDNYDDFYSAGSYVVDGFAAGITANTFKAEAKASAMADAAKDAAKAALDSHSPSREFYKIGSFAGQGFINAMGDYSSKAYDSSYNMADNAKKGLSRAISRIMDTIDSDMDTQPTIRPVLDLSDIKSGVGTMNGIFGMSPSLEVLSKVGSINSRMNARRNGANYDVISAIKDLGRTLGSATPGNTYHINGITYDDGSNITEAVESLIRAARIERRI